MVSFSPRAVVRALTTCAVLISCVAAGGVASAQVVPADRFTFDIAGFNGTSGVGYILGNSLAANFGTTQTFTAAGYNGQNYTISSMEAIANGIITDTFRISTPSNFLMSPTVNGTTITELQFDIGDANSGVSFGGVADPVNFLLPVTNYTATGQIIYGTANTVFALTPSVTLGTGGLSFSMAEGVSAGTSAISGFGIHEFDFSISYAAPVTPPTGSVPEPASWAMMILGMGAIGLAMRRQKATTRVYHAA